MFYFSFYQTGCIFYGSMKKKQYVFTNYKALFLVTLKAKLNESYLIRFYKTVKALIVTVLST